MEGTGKVLMLVGGIIIVVGIILWLFGNKLTWLGNLPGDIKIEKENFKFYFPITTMVLISLILSAVVWVIRKFL